MVESKYQVVGVAGGLGRGLMHRTKNEVPKCLLQVEGKPLLEYSLKLYAEDGFDDFILLLGHLYEKVIDYIEKSKFRKMVKYSVEKELLGKGGAIKNALDNGTIDRCRPCFLFYPDDLILQKGFPRHLASYHERKREEGALATMVSVPGTYYRYGVPVYDEKSFVKSFVEKPWVEIPANVAVYVLDPEVYKIIDECVDLSKKPVDFEKAVLPKLCEMRALANFSLDYEAWVPFNDEKDYEVGVERVKKWKLLGNF
jgi:mannose-1-phosphate guanylyltransferase